MIHVATRNKHIQTSCLNLKNNNNYYNVKHMGRMKNKKITQPKKKKKKNKSWSRVMNHGHES